MSRSLSSLTIIALATLTLGAAAHAQTPAPSNCGVETWSTSQQTYVTTPCNTGVPSGTASKADDNCGPETWSTDKQSYVKAPCTAGTTYENPGATQ